VKILHKNALLYIQHVCLLAAGESRTQRLRLYWRL